MNFSEIKPELLRKAFHLNILAFPLANLILSKSTFLTILLPLTFTVVLCDFARRKIPLLNQIFVRIFGKIMRNEEISNHRLSGISWTLLASCLVFSLTSNAIATSAFFILAISDTTASIFGKIKKSPPFFEKSIAGSSAFFLSAIPIVVICGLAFRCNFSFFVFGVFFAAVTTAIEARPSLVKVDDNFSIPVCFSFFMTLLDFMWGF